MKTSGFESSAHSERAVLGSLVLQNDLWPQIGGLRSEDFCLDSHRVIFACMTAMLEDQRPADLVTLPAELSRTDQLDSCGGCAYIAGLIDDALPENLATYIDLVREASRTRRISRQFRLLSATSASSSPERLSILREQTKQLSELLAGNPQQEDWRTLFHSYEDVMKAPIAKFAIEGFLQEDGITLIGGLAGHGKTLCMLAMVRALMEGGKLFHHFAVNKPAERVIYLIPEAGLGPFSARLKMFRLQDHVHDHRLFCRTLSAPGSLVLSDPRLLDAVKGADVFLDTAVRFMVGDENSATEQKAFADTLFALQRAGARTITGAHHSPKSFGKDTIMTLENVLRGSGDIGAMLCTCWGLISGRCSIQSDLRSERETARLPAVPPFVIQGRPSIDETGYFELTEPPGFAGSFGDNKPHAGRSRIRRQESKNR